MIKAKRKYGFEPDYAVAPGETLREVIESMGMTQTELSVRTGLTIQSISRILSGTQPITYETANLLELVTGVSATFWNNLEANYRGRILKIQAMEEQQSNRQWLKTIPTKALIARGYIEHSKDESIIFRNVLSFYGVGSVKAWRNLWEKPAVAARRSQCFKTHPGAASAWLRMGEIQAGLVECASYDENLFREALLKIKKLTKEVPEVFTEKLRSLCAQAGVAIALVPEVRAVPWNGASKWLTPDKSMILLSLRGKGEDKFWFSFFHEASHILNDSKKSISINDGSSDDPAEVRANMFAADFLIPSNEYDDMISKFRSKGEICELAKELDISPGIVAGRFQFLTGKWNYFKALIRKFEWI